MKRIKMLIVTLTLLIFPSLVSAASVERTTQLNLRQMDLTINQEDLSEGWSWDATNKVLTLKDINFNVEGKEAIMIPGNLEFTITLVGDNKIKSRKASSNNGNIRGIGYKDSIGDGEMITVNGTGTLEVTIDDEAPALSLPNINITSGKIKLIGGGLTTVHSIIISGGELDIDTLESDDSGAIYTNGFIHITGGKVEVKTKSAGIFVPGIGDADIETGVKITGGNITIDAEIKGIYAGYKYGSFDIKKNVEITGGTIDFKNSPAGIHSANGKVTIKKGSKITVKEGAPIYSYGANNDVQELIIDSADYTKIDSLLASLPSDFSKYTDESVANLESAKANIVRDKNFLEQSLVDSYVTALENAINNLKVKTFNITTKKNTTADVTIKDATNVEYGSSRELSVAAKTGYILKTLKINGVDRTKDLVNGKLTLQNITTNLEIEVETTAEKYVFVEGKDAIYNKENLTFKLNGVFSLFDKLYVNGVELSKDNYTVVEGSTIITLKNEYLQTLKPATYKLKATYKNGSSDETTFTIKEEKVNEENVVVENPKTSDNVLLYACVNIISVIGVVGARMYLKKLN